MSCFAAGSGSNTASDGKLLLHMGSVKSQTLYIVLFFQMCCLALKLLIFPCLTGKSQVLFRFLSRFPQGYVRTIGYMPRTRTALHNCFWLDGKWRPGERDLQKGEFDSTRRPAAYQCRNLVQSCGFVWKARKTGRATAIGSLRSGVP